MKSVFVTRLRPIAPGKSVPFLNGTHHPPLRLLGDGTQHVVDDVGNCSSRDTR